MNNIIETPEAAANLDFSQASAASSVFGAHGAHLKFIERELGVSIHTRGGAVQIRGDRPSVDLARQILTELYDLAREGYPIFAQDVDYAIRILSGQSDAPAQGHFPGHRVHHLPQAGGHAQRAWPRRPISPPSAKRTSFSASVRPAPARRTWPWPWPSPD